MAFFYLTGSGLSHGMECCSAFVGSGLECVISVRLVSLDMTQFSTYGAAGMEPCTFYGHDHCVFKALLCFVALIIY